jgi:hypothetical protein
MCVGLCGVCVFVCVGWVVCVCVGVVCVCVSNNHYSKIFTAIYCSAISILLNDSLPTVDSNTKSIRYHNIPYNSNRNTIPITITL